MYFKKLELVGFKSFMDKTTLNFEPGVTAIVGPNGCGKSNIFDAIRWVLGEQSVKSLRGSQMEDVIFNGTDAKQPLNMAEVSLTFDNENKFFPVEHKEVMITRRIFRSGESEYQLNKAQVRLKDILDLLMGTGIGAESYSLVAQGKIDLILSSRPEDRRLVFDEAAGITKYKAQKKDALRKLEETQQNLLRVSDIIAEVKRSIGYLERQANKARRFQEVFGELKSKEICLSTFQIGKLKQAKDEICGQLQSLKDKEEQLQQMIGEAVQNIEEKNRQLNSRKENTAVLKNQILQLENTVSSDKQHVNFNKERIAELENTMKYLESQVEHISGRVIQDEEKLRKLREEELAIRKNIDEKTVLLKEKEGLLNELLVSTKQAQDTITKAKKMVLELATKASHLKNEITEITSKKNILQARKKRLEVEKAKIGEERLSAEVILTSLVAELRQIEETLQGFQLQLSEVNKELSQETVLLERINADLIDLERKKLTLQSHKEFLQKLKTQYESIDTSMNALIYLDRLPQEKISGLVIKIKDYIQTQGAQEGLNEAVNIKLSGEAKPIDLDTQRVEERIQQIEQSIFALNQTKQAKETLSEELRQKMQDLQQKIQEQEKALGNKRAIHQATSEQFNKIREEEDIVIIESQDVHRELAVLEEQLIQLETNAGSLDKEQRTQEALIHQEQDRTSANAASKEEILVFITRIKTELEVQLKRLNTEDSTIKMVEETYQQNKESFKGLKYQIEETIRKQGLLESEIKTLEGNIDRQQKNIQYQITQLKEEEKLSENAALELDVIVKQIEEKKRELQSAKDEVYSLQMEEKDLDFKYCNIKERILQAYKVDIDTALADIGQQTGEEKPSLENKMVCCEQNTEVETQEEIKEEALCEDIKSLRSKIDSYGSVNLVAIEEYDELKKRYDFLTQQQNDLNSAKESIHDAINKINRTTRKMFMETFERLAEEFRNHFRLLFNGGDAKIFLVDEQDPLESGIEIICRPPGKKLQNVLLLSGGEKSLAASALIFAIFKVKPAPFCILDEIDAALDESNVDRFSRLLQEFTKTSQFIVITHNKKTIVNANVMYGITMVESGVSRIVSVKFSGHKDKAKDMEPAVV